MTDYSRSRDAARRSQRRGWRAGLALIALLAALAAPALAQDAGEIEFWKSVQNTKNPAELQAYLQAYPHGRFAPLAQLRIARLREGSASAAPGPGNSVAAGIAVAPPVTTPARPTTLAAAIRAGDVSTIRALIAIGADVNAWDDAGLPPIGLAALLGRTDIIAFLAASGADVNRNDRYGFTPLMDAAIRGQPGAARMLLALGADPTLKGRNGNDPLGAAAPTGYADRFLAGKLAIRKMLEAAAAGEPNGATQR